MEDYGYAVRFFLYEKIDKKEDPCYLFFPLQNQRSKT